MLRARAERDGWKVNGRWRNRDIVRSEGVDEDVISMREVEGDVSMG